MDRQEKELLAFQAEFDVMKTEYDLLGVKEHEGTILPSEWDRMQEIEALYHQDKEKFDVMLNERKQKQRDNTEKEFNNAKMAWDKTQVKVADLVARVAT